MSANLDSANLEPLSRESRSEEVLTAMLVSLWRRKWLIMAVMVATLVLGVIAILVMPYRYSAEAYIRGEFFAAPDMVAKDDESVTTGSLRTLSRLALTGAQRLADLLDLLCRIARLLQRHAF